MEILISTLDFYTKRDGLEIIQRQRSNGEKFLFKAKIH